MIPEGRLSGVVSQILPQDKARNQAAKIMSSVLLTAFTLLVIAAADVAALKCYSCVEIGDDACSKEKLEGNPAKYSVNCSSLFDRCLRQENEALGIKGVSTTCFTQSSCTTLKSNCDKKTTGYETCEDVVCCDTDNCNGGSAVSFSVFLMTICCAVGLVLVK